LAFSENRHGRGILHGVGPAVRGGEGSDAFRYGHRRRRYDGSGDRRSEGLIFWNTPDVLGETAELTLADLTATLDPIDRAAKVSAFRAPKR
jgi:hypothetical protein